MKRMLLIMTLSLFLPNLVSAPKQFMNDFFQNAMRLPKGLAACRWGRKMMQTMSRQAAEHGDKGLAVLLEDIQYIRIVALAGGDGEQLVRDAEAAVASERKFREAASTTEDGQTTKFYIRETALAVKSELVMITYGAKETVVVNIYGVFDLKQIARLSSIRPQ